MECNPKGNFFSIALEWRRKRMRELSHLTNSELKCYNDSSTSSLKGEKMRYFASLIQSFSELTIATGGVVRDAWRDKHGQLPLLVAFAVFLGLLPYVINGIQALLLNELVRAFSTKSFGW